MNQTDIKEAALSAADKAALERAVEIYRAAGRWQRSTIDSLIARGDSQEEVGRYAAFHCQCEQLGLAPWQVAPCDVRDIARDLVRTDERAERTGLRSAAQLLRRMLAAGLSRYEPRPLQALERAEQRRTAK
jgi:hypothetical protein